MDPFLHDSLFLFFSSPFSLSILLFFNVLFFSRCPHLTTLFPFFYYFPHKENTHFIWLLSTLICLALTTVTVVLLSCLLTFQLSINIKFYLIWFARTTVSWKTHLVLNYSKFRNNKSRRQQKKGIAGLYHLFVSLTFYFAVCKKN